MVPGAIPGALELLDELKAGGYRLCGLSNWSAETFPLARDAYECFDRLDDIVISGELDGVGKPDREAFDLVAERNGLTPASTVFVDDTERNTIAAASYGYRVVTFTDTPSLRAALAAMGVRVSPVGSDAMSMTWNMADLFESVVDAVPDRRRRGGARRSRRATGLHLRRARCPGEPARTRPAGAWREAGRQGGDLRVQRQRLGRGAVGRLEDPRRGGERQLPLRRGRARATCSTTPTRRARRRGASSRHASRRSATSCPSCGRSSRSTTASDEDLVAHRRRRTTRPRWPRRRPSATSSRAPTTTSTCSTPAAPPGCPRASCGARRTSSCRRSARSLTLAEAPLERARGGGRAGAPA